MKHLYYSLLSIVFLSVPVVASGRGLGDAGGLLKDVGARAGADGTDLPSAVGSAVGIVLSLVGLIFLVLMVYAGVLWLTARGEEGPINTAKKIVLSAVIGLFLTVSAYAITILVTGRLGS